MGYRSTFVTTDTHIKLPEWFVTKYQNSVHFGLNSFGPDDTSHPSFPISAKAEGKMYGMYAELKDDIQRILDDLPEPRTVGLAILHEDCEYEIVTFYKSVNEISFNE